MLNKNKDYCVARGFTTPPPTSMSKSRLNPWQAPWMPMSERKRSSPVNENASFHVMHKVPAGDSPYVKAKHVQLIDKDPSRAISMFWASINAGDRVDSALKDMALTMKQLDRSDEAIEAIRSFRHLCPADSQESLDNILVELYKRSGRIEEEIEMLHHKLKQIEEGKAFDGKRTKQARSQGKKIQITIEQELSRVLGNLAWAYMQNHDHKSAEEYYRKALSLEADRNKQCNLAICLMQMQRIAEAKFLLQAVKASSKHAKMDESYAKSFERACSMLNELEGHSRADQIEVIKPTGKSNISNSQNHISCGYDKGVKPIGEVSGQTFWGDNVKDRNEPWQWQCPQVNNVHSCKRGDYLQSCHNKAFGFATSKAENCVKSPKLEVQNDLLDNHNSPYSRSCKVNLSDRLETQIFDLGVHLNFNPSVDKEEASSQIDSASGGETKLESEATVVGDEDERQVPSISEKTWTSDTNSLKLSSSSLQPISGTADAPVKKSWADIMEEEEEYGNENLNSNIVNDAEKLSEKLEDFNLRDAYGACQDAFLSRNSTVQRLCIGMQLKQDSDDCFPSLTSIVKDSEDGQKKKAIGKFSMPWDRTKPERRNRLQVFQDITGHPRNP